MEGKRIIRLATGRPIWSFSEFVPEIIPGLGDPERIHPFSLIVLRLVENNEGEGTFCVAVQMKYNKKNASLSVENLAQDHVHLTRITKTN